MALIGNVINPPIPYIAYIPGGNLTTGKQITVQGAVPYNSQGFGVNLANGNVVGHTRSDTAFHFNPRFNENCVVRNSLRSNNWANEERHGGMPFAKGTPFELKIICELTKYQVIINGSYFCDFQHRLPLAGVNTITIEGDVSIKAVQYFEPQPPPYQPPPMGFPAVPPAAPMGFPAAPGGAPIGYPGSPPMPLYNPAVPLTTGIPNGLHHGKMIFISGTPTAATRFNFNLQDGHSHNADVGLHFDVRFNFGSSVNTVVRNHRSVGQWGQEERNAQYFPFIPNTPFEMIILCENTGYKVAVNNQHFIEFRHRLMPFAKFNMLSIGGDVRITQVRFQ